jgi:hypothetical protein
MSFTKTLKSTPTSFDQQLIVIREFVFLVKITELKCGYSYVVMR